MTRLLKPDWQVASNIQAYSTTRMGGVSAAPYRSLNLGDHVQDRMENVMQNRSILRQSAELPNEPFWLEQIHGTQVYLLDSQLPQSRQVDAVYTRQRQQVCAVLTADCLPVLFCSVSGDEIAAAHAGWRGLCHGILENTIACFQSSPASLIAWLGPAIGPSCFEVGAEVRAAFMAYDEEAVIAFTAHGDKYLADIYQLARQRLQKLGVYAIYGGDHCTVTEQELFFSYRRDGITGRMASLIWLE